MSKKSKYDDTPLKNRIKPIFKERFREMLNSDSEYQKFEEIILKPQRKSFRINSLKCKNPQLLVKNLENKGLKLKEIPWSKNSFFVEYDENFRSDLGNLFEHFSGEIYVQEATSMTPPEVLDIPESIDNDFKVLDMAASPGSKTTQIAEKMKNKGVLVANELDYKRLSPLKTNLERSGFLNILITNLDGAKIEGEEIFDRILLDAPCSGSGVIRKSPKTIITYNPKKLKSMQKLQLKLLKRAFELLKKGGLMTYSTCSLDPEENELCIKKFLEEEKDAKLEPIKLKGLILSNKILEFQGEKIPSEIVDNSIRIWPQDNDTNGFYLCKIRKN
jgi:NOL1/NOP2/sun family putative RNA methylase